MSDEPQRADAAPVTWAEFRQGAKHLLELAYRIDLYGMDRTDDNYERVAKASEDVNAFFGPIVSAGRADG